MLGQRQSWQFEPDDEDDNAGGGDVAFYEDNPDDGDEDAPNAVQSDWDNVADELSGTSDEDAPQFFGG